MHPFSVDVLEFAKVKAILRRYVSSAPGGACVDSLEPRDAPQVVRGLLAETREAQRLLEENLPPPLTDISDLLPLLERSEPQGAMMEGKELREVRSNWIAAQRMAEFLAAHAARLPLLSVYGRQITPRPELVEAIDRAVDKDGLVRDGASPLLSRLRKRSREVRRELTDRLARIMRRPEVRAILQEQFVTIRSGRHVLPVLSGERRKIKGIVHDRSATGTTLYIEPEETVELGNRLRELEAEEQVEVQRILRELTGRLRRHFAELRANQAALAHLDFTTAKARFAIEFRCCIPQLVDQGTLRLRQARHPLLVALAKDRVVANDVLLPYGIRGLVITGPNTGGKTVLLKTIGLAVVLAHCGVPVPCSDAEIPACSAVLADIGDEQSIEQSLSTFSSHIARIRWVLETADTRSLVLLDELGAGTDPLEGAALATALAREICRRAACVIMTTHLAELKVMAYETEGMENAAMRFDPHSLSPTYELEIGSAGRSNALSIAERLGIPAPVLEQARATVQLQEERPEQVLAQLYADRDLAARQREEATRELEKSAELRRRRALALQKAERMKEDLLQRARASTTNLVREVEDEVAAARRRLRALRQHAERLQARLSTEARTVIGEELAAMEAEVAQVEGEAQAVTRVAHALQQPSPPEYALAPFDLATISVGDRVEIHGYTQLGEVLEINTRRRTLRVAMGLMELVVKADHVVGVATPATVQARPVVASTTEYAAVPEPPPSLDIIGKTVEEMLPLVEQYVEQASLFGLTKVTIVHGFGTGALRKAVREALATNPCVSGIEDGDVREGGRAVTVVRLRKR